MRKYRKREHIENYLRTTYVGDPLFDDVFLYHNSLPEIDFAEINTSTTFLNKRVNFPLMVNAMTGGSDFTQGINEDLARAASEFNIPMAVGSQTILSEDEDAVESFRVVRQVMKDGIVIANLNGHATLDEARYAVELLGADGLQIHLNPAQELAMEEGDRNFKNILLNISNLVQQLEVPIIVKEVGFGLSAEVIESLYQVGIRHVDVSGFGGTNFFEVENLRTPDNDLSELYGWGIPTAMAIVEAKKLDHPDLQIVSSGGVKNSLHIAKSIVLGASMVGISGEILSYLIHGGYEYTLKYIANLIYKTKMIMLLTGAKNIRELQMKPYRTMGKLSELLKGVE